ncbi:MAG: CoA-binding protein, partial [Chloroflexi bacterium]|nr:CoA-binding protein [Chloroflexota bacterium]
RAIIAVPPAAVADVIRECGAKGIRAAQVLTAGFREAGAAGQELENQLAQAAREANVRIVGPNSIGTYCPNGRIVMSQGSPVESGSIAFVSHSGGLGRDVIHRGAVRGLRFSKVVSAGNCCDLDVPDYLEFLAIDPDTRIIGLYVEGVRDGRRLLDLIRSTTPTKPVVVLKGGQTELGSRAAASHTGALASDFAVWQSVLRQCGAILADDLEDLIDILVGLALTPLPTGRKVSLIGNGGGATVTASDAFDRVRLWMPDFDEITQQRLAALNLPPGTSLKNPVDAPIGTLRLNEGQVLQEILGIILEDTQIDSIVVHLNLLAILDLAPYEIASQYLQRMVGAVTTVGQRQKPLLLSLRSTGEDVQEQACRAESIKAVAAGVPVYPDIPAAARVLSKLAGYREYLGRAGNL